MLMPKRVKFRKQHRGHRRGKASGGNELNFGQFGLQALESCWMTANQIEAARKVMARYATKSGKVWIRIFPDHPYTQKPAEVKMGKGKGDPVGFVAEVKPGRIMFEIDGVEPAVAAEALRKAGTKLPVKTKIVSRV